MKGPEMRGSVIKRGTKWSAVVTIGEKRKWLSGYSTRREAVAARTEALASLAKEAFVVPSKLTVAEYLESWARALGSEGLSLNTESEYRSVVATHMIPRLGQIPLQKLSPAHVKGFYADLLASGRADGSGGLAPRTVNLVGTVLGKALSEAATQQLIVRNPAQGVKKPRSSKKSVGKTWTAAELRAFLSHVAGDRLFAVWHVAAMTGMRRSELLAVRWTDIDFEHNRVAIRRALVLVGNEPVMKETTKTASSSRLITLDEATVRALRDWKRKQLEEKLQWGEGYKALGLVASREDGSLIHPERFSRWFDARVRDAGLPKIRLHDLRHTYATLALQAGVHPKVVQERLGHSSISVTLDTYSHAIPAIESEAAERVASLILG